MIRLQKQCGNLGILPPRYSRNSYSKPKKSNKSKQTSKQAKNKNLGRATLYNTTRNQGLNKIRVNMIQQENKRTLI